MMKNRVLFALAVCLIPLPAVADGTRVMEAVQKSIVYVTAEQKDGKSVSGSGVIVMDDEVLTNCHVIDNAQKITVQFSDGQKMPATIKGRVGKLDMCALSALTYNRPKAATAQVKDIKPGQPIYAIGNPLSLKLTISDGIVSSVRDTGSEKVLQITTPISPGSSGGGVFDEKGRLLGLTTFTLTEGQNLNFAIPVEYRYSIGLSPVENVESQGSIRKGKGDLIYVGEIQDAKLYLKTKNARRKENMVLAWVIMDFFKPRYNKPLDYHYQSASVLQSFDCSSGKSAMLAFIQYENEMGTGKEQFSVRSDPDEVKYFSPKNDVDKATYEMACEL